MFHFPCLDASGGMHVLPSFDIVCCNHVDVYVHDADVTPAALDSLKCAVCDQIGDV